MTIDEQELAALRRDRERLRTADELWRMETGESLIETVDQISEAMLAGLRAGDRPIRRPDGRPPRDRGHGGRFEPGPRAKRARATSPGPEPTRSNTVGGSIADGGGHGQEEDA